VSNETVIAVATAVNVAVTAVYAFFTWRLWQETRRQAGLTEQQAQATAEQTRITRQIFEASHRPVVGLTGSNENYVEAANFYRLDFEATNNGQVPAILAESRLVVRREADMLLERVVPGRGRCIFPGKGAALEFGGTKGGVILGAAGAVDVELTVSYTGFDDVIRTSRLAVVGNFDGWTRMLTEIR
jgi:hypothetical protein